MPDLLEDEIQGLELPNFSAGQFSAFHPADKVIPINGCQELLNANINNTLGRLDKRKGYAIAFTDLGSVKISGLVGFNPAGGTALLMIASDGEINRWNGSDAGSSSSKTGLTAADLTELVVGLDRVFRFSKVENIWSSADGITFDDEGNTNTDFPRSLFGLWASNQRMFAFNGPTETNLGWYSGPGTPRTGWNRTTNAFAFGEKSIDGTTGAIEWTSKNILVFTKNKMFNWNIADLTPSNWFSETIADIGCEAFRTVKQFGSDVLFLSRDGVRSAIQSAQDKKRGVSLPLSFPIKDWIDRINWANVHKANACVWNDMYKLCVPIDANTENSHALVFSKRAFDANGGKGGWSIWDNININAWTIQKFSGKSILYGGESSADGKVYQVRSSDPDDNSNTDNGTNITLSVTTKRLDLEKSFNDKTGSFCELRAIAQDGGNITQEVQLDGGGYQDLDNDLSQIGSAVSLPVSLPFNLGSANIVKQKNDIQQFGRWRNIQFRFIEATANISQIINFVISAFIENIDTD